MVDSLEDRFASLARVAKDLNAVSDEVTDRLRGVEERLRALGLGVEAELPTPMPRIDDISVDELDLTEDEEVPRTWTGNISHLGYKKIAGSWRLVARTYHCRWLLSQWDDPEHENAPPEDKFFLSERPLLDCSRDIRLAAAGQVDLLLAAIESAAQERITRLHRPPADPAKQEQPEPIAVTRPGGPRRARRTPSDKSAR